MARKAEVLAFLAEVRQLQGQLASAVSAKGDGGASGQGASGGVAAGGDGQEQWASVVGDVQRVGERMGLLLQGPASGPPLVPGAAAAVAAQPAADPGQAAQPALTGQWLQGQLDGLAAELLRVQHEVSHSRHGLAAGTQKGHGVITVIDLGCLAGDTAASGAVEGLMPSIESLTQLIADAGRCSSIHCKHARTQRVLPTMHSTGDFFCCKC